MSTIATIIIRSGAQLVLRTPGPQGPAGPTSGDVNGPASSTTGNVAVMADGTGKLLADGGQTPAQLKDRANHTGSQAIATVTGLQTALDTKEVAGASSASMSAHLAAVDPHTQYTTAGEAAAAAPVQSVAGRTGAVTLVKGDVGLGSVDNTADTAKPVSTAQQTALNGKSDTGHTHADATTGASGFMPAGDKTKVDALGTAAYTASGSYAPASHTHNASDINAGTLPTGRMPAHTGEVTSSAGAVALTITNDAVTNAKLANMAASTIKGNNTGSAADPIDLTAAQAQALLSLNTTRGDMTVRGASADQRLAVGAVASTFVSDGTDPKWRHSSRIIQYHDHFIGAGSTSWCLGWLTASNVGGGNTVAVAGASNAPGILEINTGTGASNDRTLVHATVGAFVLGNGVFDVEWRFRIPTLSTSGERFLIRIGCGKGQGAVPADGFWIECVDNVNSGNFQIGSAKASSSAMINSSIAPTTGWTKVRLIGNASGTQIDVYIDGVLAGSVTDASKIPTTASFSLWAMIQKSVSTAARSLQVDYVELYHELTNPL